MKPAKLIYTAAMCFVAASIATSHADSDKSVTAAQVNGTWKREFGEFRIWALGKQRLQVQFSGVYEYKTPQGPMANEGEDSGIATIEGDTAIFKPEGAEEECRITLKFSGDKLVVRQTGICGFGHSVSGEGTYKKFRLRSQSSDRMELRPVPRFTAVATGLWPVPSTLQLLNGHRAVATGGDLS